MSGGVTSCIRSTRCLTVWYIKLQVSETANCSYRKQRFAQRPQGTFGIGLNPTGSVGQQDPGNPCGNQKPC